MDKRSRVSLGVEGLQASAAAHVVLPVQQQLVGGLRGHGVAEGRVLQQLQQAQALRAPFQAGAVSARLLLRHPRT